VCAAARAALLVWVGAAKVAGAPREATSAAAVPVLSAARVMRREEG